MFTSKLDFMVVHFDWILIFVEENLDMFLSLYWMFQALGGKHVREVELWR